MSHLRVIQIVKGAKNVGDSLKVLPGTFVRDTDAQASIKEDGDYLFLEVHSITVKKGKKENGKNNDKQEPAEQ